MIPKLYTKYPAQADSQVVAGMLNGTWAVWFLNKGVAGKIYYQSSKEDALEMFDNLVSVIKEQQNDPGSS